MSTFLAHPSIFSAYAATAESDPDLNKGTHLRLFPSGMIGFPLAPFALWDVPAQSLRAPAFAWFNRHGEPLGVLDLDQADGEAIGWLTALPPRQARLIGMEAHFHSGDGEIAILDRIDHRVITARSASRFLVGAPMVTRVRLRGRGPVTPVGWVVTPDTILERIIGSEPFDFLGLPIEGDAPWYADGEGRDVAWERVGSGAPQRWTRPDRPDGPFGTLTDIAEEARVAALRPELDDHVKAMVQDAATPPAKVVEVHESAAGMVAGVRRPWQRATLEIQNALLLKALDTGAGRYLGLMTRLEHLPQDQNRRRAPTATAWLAAGAFACHVGDPARLPPPDEFESRLLERLVGLLPGLERVIAHARRGVRDGIWIDVVDGRRHAYRLEIRAFVAAALAAPPPDLLAPPDVRLGPAQWLREREGPSFRFRQQFLVNTPPLAALAALARLEPDGWTSRHEMITLAPGANPPVRAAAKLFGRRESLVDGRTGLVDDPDIPETGAPWAYRLALSDVFGRFGAPTDLSVPLPARPAIPIPGLQAQLHLAPRASHRQPAAAGTVAFRIPVPAVETLTAGSIPLASARVSFNGATKTATTPQAGGELQLQFDLPKLAVMETRRLEARAHFVDVDSNVGADATLAVDIADPRAPDIPKSGIGIIWSSRPGPSEDVEFRLAFQGQPGARYRTYLSDARGLAIPVVVPFAGGERPRTRAEIAVDGANRAGLSMRDRFRLITEPPLEPGPDGSVRLDTRLPRTLETVQFLRFVPLSARNAEAAFESCPLLPIAVPSDRRPPAPRLQTAVDAATGGARVTIVAEGLDRVALQAAEPGLFGGTPAAAARPPSFRLRRASGPVPEVIYARPVATGPLAADGDTFIADVADMPTPDGLIPFVRYFYWAEVQMPPERRIPADVTEVPLTAGAIRPSEARQREDAPGEFSLSSPPAMVMRVPSDPPALAPGSITVTKTAATPAVTYTLAVRITGGPRAHAKAVNQYRIRLHIRENGGDFSAVPSELVLVGEPFVWSVQRPAAVVPQVTVMLVPIDPIGREGVPVLIEAVVT